MTHSETVGAIAAVLAKAQGVMEGAAKDSKNPHFQSQYADLASVVGACRAPLSAQGISYLQSSFNDGNLVSMRTLLIHTSGEWIESDVLRVQARDAGPQAVGSCLTYLRRYQLAALVGVAPEDDDAEAAEGRPQKGGYTVEAPAPSTPGKKAPKTKTVMLADGEVVTKAPTDPMAELDAIVDEASAARQAIMEGIRQDTPGALYIERVTSKPTKNPNVTKYTLVLSDGREVGTIRDKVAALAEQCCQERTPVRVQTAHSKFGEDLTDLKLDVDAVDADEPRDADEAF